VSLVVCAQLLLRC